MRTTNGDCDNPDCGLCRADGEREAAGVVVSELEYETQACERGVDPQAFAKAEYRRLDETSGWTAELWRAYICAHEDGPHVHQTPWWQHLIARLTVVAKLGEIR